ncbi:MAG: hypothetical protein CK530_09515 [Planctomycetaceae bacterium]|nr:MAG: hypothetical protein CK530_09515 [Planctomycetaceae bacterium]
MLALALLALHVVGRRPPHHKIKKLLAVCLDAVTFGIVGVTGSASASAAGATTTARTTELARQPLWGFRPGAKDGTRPL